MELLVETLLRARLRRLNEEDHIILFEKGEYISFANCGLPYHVRGVIKERQDLLLQTVEGMNSQYGLDVRNFSGVARSILSKICHSPSSSDWRNL